VLTSGTMADVTFVAEGKPVRAHRMVVAARCARLAAMLAFHRRFAEAPFYSLGRRIPPHPPPPPTHPPQSDSCCGHQVLPGAAHG
jgi:hypothetical protein